MKLKWSFSTTDKIYEDALNIRKRVFIEEQGVDPELEIDGMDSSCYHFVGYSDGKAITTARLLIKENATVKIQRFATLPEFRGKYFGHKLLSEIETWAQASGLKTLVLSAQDSAIPFYEKAGFQISHPEGYMEAGIPHHDMAKHI